MKISSILAVACACAFRLISAAEPAVEIPMDQPLPAGARFAFTGELIFRKQVVQQTPQGPQAKVQNAALNLNGAVTVVGVNAGGCPAEFRVEVQKGQWRENNGPATAIKPGTIVRVWRDTLKQRMSVNAVEQESTLSDLLGKLFCVQHATDLRPWAYVSPGHPVRPGDQWPLRGELFVKGIAKYGIEGALPAQVKGDVQFTSLGNLGGQPSAEVTINFELDSTTASQAGEDLVGVERVRSKERCTEERSLNGKFPASRSDSETVFGFELFNKKNREAPPVQIQTQTIRKAEFIPIS
jgi:hypothetical protein